MESQEKKQKKTRIKWDEEVIAEHDKLRGTRQKIDEPPTPFRYRSDSEHSDAESMDIDPDHDPNHNPSAADTGLKDEANSGIMRMNSEGSPGTELKDNWEALHAKLNYHEQQQNTSDPLAARTRREISTNNDDSSNDAGSTPTTPSRRHSAHLHVTHAPVPESEHKGGPDPANDPFRAKRAAHYNEYKVLQALRIKLQKSPDSFEDELTAEGTGNDGDDERDEEGVNSEESSSGKIFMNGSSNGP